MSQSHQAEPLVHIGEPHGRMTEFRFQPGAETGWHRHMADYVVVPLLDGDLLLEERGGRLGDGAPQAARALRAA